MNRRTFNDEMPPPCGGVPQQHASLAGRPGRQLFPNEARFQSHHFGRVHQSERLGLVHLSLDSDHLIFVVFKEAIFHSSSNKNNKEDRKYQHLPHSGTGTLRGYFVLLPQEPLFFGLETTVDESKQTADSQTYISGTKHIKDNRVHPGDIFWYSSHFSESGHSPNSTPMKVAEDTAR